MANVFTTLYPAIQNDPTTSSLLEQYVKKQTLPKGATLAIAGEINTRLYYIETGLARVYYADADADDDTTAWLVVDGRFAVVPGSFFRQQLSNYTIQLLERSIVHSIGYDDLQQLYEASVTVNMVARNVLEEYVLQYEWRVRLLQVRSCERRYALFSRHFGKHMNRLQNKHIASFLGMTKHTLSRIRTQQARK